MTRHGLAPPSLKRDGRALRAPAVVGSIGLAGAGLLLLRDPHTPGSYGLCPFNALTGLYCPGCGGTRAAYDLLHFDVAAAISSNVFAVVLIATLLVAYLRWIPARMRAENARMIVLPARVSMLVLTALFVFTIVRNTPAGAWLAP